MTTLVQDSTIVNTNNNLNIQNNKMQCLNKKKKKILMSEYIKLSKDFLTQEEVKYFNYLLDDASKKAP